MELCLNPKAGPTSVRTPPFLADDLGTFGRQAGSFSITQERDYTAGPSLLLCQAGRRHALCIRIWAKTWLSR